MYAPGLTEGHFAATSKAKPGSAGMAHPIMLGGRLIGTLLSGIIFEYYGFIGCLLASGAFVLTAAVLSFNLPRAAGVPLTVELKEAES